MAPETSAQIRRALSRRCAALGIPAIAYSTEPKSINTIGQHLDRVWNFLQAHQLLKKHSIYNINIPAQPTGIRITRQGGPYFSDDFLPQENNMYLPRGKCVYAPSQVSDLDTDAVLTHKEISIMPLTVQRVDLQVYEQLKMLQEEEAFV
jgi:broad specificity polyphosphatase/5'/3'-nucleotidase SurE